MWGEKRFNARAAAKDGNDVDGHKTVNELIQNGSRRFREGDTILEDKPRSWRPSVCGR